MDALLKLIAANPKLLEAIITPLINAIVEQAGENPEFLAKFIKSIIDLFDQK